MLTAVASIDKDPTAGACIRKLGSRIFKTAAGMAKCLPARDAMRDAPLQEIPPMDTIKPLFTATATATGGRNGRTEAADGSVKAELSVPKAMGGTGKAGTTTPEH